MGRASPVLSSMVTLIVFALAGGEQLNMANAFVTVSVFQSLRLALIMIPLATQALMAVSVSLERVEKYLLSEEVPDRKVIPRINENMKGEALLSLMNVSFAFPASHLPVLQDLTCTVKGGEIVALCGSVGSGKTTFLRGALQLMRARKGDQYVSDFVGYVPQRALVIGGTLKDNILMGREFDLRLFDDCITKSQLKRDIDMFPTKEMTEVGERGSKLER
jgi:ATP-binding cassette subfamily C (CFTR/MRP) protein 2